MKRELIKLEAADVEWIMSAEEEERVMCMCSFDAYLYYSEAICFSIDFCNECGDVLAAEVAEACGVDVAKVRAASIGIDTVYFYTFDAE